MKYTLLILALTVSSCPGNDTSVTKAQAAEIRKVHEEKRDQAGQIVVYIDTVYRGKEQILVTYQLLKKNQSGLHTVRAFFANGKNVVDELDYDNGTRIIRIYKDDVLSEMFKQPANGSVEPVSTEELVSLQSRQRELLESIKK